MKTKSAIVAIAIGLAGFVDAEGSQVYTPASNDIKSIGSYSALYPVDSTLQGFSRVFFTQPVVWSTAICDVGSVFIRGEDKALIADAQVALASGRAVQVFTDDTLPRPYGICVLTYIQYE